MSSWPTILLPPQDGEQVNSAVTGRALMQLLNRTDYLYQALSTFSAQNGKLVIQNAVLDPSVQAGDWLYYDAPSQTYKQAISEGVYDPTIGQYVATPRSYVVGLCLGNTNNMGPVLLSGWVDSLSALGLTPSLMVESGTYTPGRYYLSRKQPGKMTIVGGAPIVQLGFFTGDTAFVSPIQKDIFESHIHYNFPLIARPASSQNTSGSGWTTISNTAYVDYFSTTGSTAIPNILMSIKGNGQAALSGYGSNFRVELYEDSGGLMGVDVYGGSGLDQSVITSGTPITSVTGVAWPSYGQWYAVPNTGLSVAFVRQDGTYTNTLAVDIAAAIATSTDRYKVFLPNDLSGWTNTNPFDGNYAAGTLYRYVRETSTALNAVWPPVPTSSVGLSNNGLDLTAGVDFSCVPQDLFWIPGSVNSSTSVLYAPWPYDYNCRTPEDPASAYIKVIDIFFIKANISTAKPIVTSLQSSTPAISISDCLTGNPSNSGNLTLDLTLDLNAENGPDASQCIASVDPATQKFLLSSLVSRITAGSGIKIIGTTTNAVGQQSGAVTISTDGIQTSGEVDVVSLKNAKESLYNGVVPCILFLPPATAGCQIVSKIKIPASGLSGTISFQIQSLIFGSTAVGSGTTQVATFQSTHYVLRAGTVLTSLVPAAAFATQYWTVQLGGASAYTPYTILSNQYPTPPYMVTAGSPTPGGLVMTSGTINGVPASNLLPGDSILTVISRVASLIDGETDTYAGNIGLTGINWSITTTP